MSTDEREIQPLREFRDRFAEPPADRLVRMRARILNQAGTAPARRRSGRSIAVPAVVGAAVLAVAVGAAVVGFDGSVGGDAIPVGNQPSANPPVPATDPTPADKTSSTAEPPSPAEHDAAVALLEGFAEAAGSGPAPLTVPAGKLLYVAGTGATSNGGSRQAYLHELWVDVNGGIVVMIRRSDDGQVTVVSPDPSNPKDNHDAEVAAQRQELERNGPSLRRPTPAFLAALPSDPDALLEQIRTVAAGSAGPWSADHAIMDYLRQFLYTAEPLITPQVRASLYRAMAKLDSISSTGQPIQIDGRSVYAIAQSERDGRQELLLDAQSGRVVGSRSVLGGEADSAFYDLWTYAAVDQAGSTR